MLSARERSAIYGARLALVCLSGLCGAWCAMAAAEFAAALLRGHRDPTCTRLLIARGTPPRHGRGAPTL